MKKNRSLVLWLVLALVVIAVSLAGCGSGSGETPAAPGAAELAVEEPEKKEVVTVRASVPADWVMNGGAVRLWAWKEGGEDVFEAWPGEEMILDDNGWFTATVPGWVDRVIINGYDGTVQTADLPVDAGYDIWVVVHDDLSAEVSLEEPEKKEVVTVRASVPVDWVMDGGAVRLWAWKEGGEDVFEAWPGEEMIPDDYGWFTTTVPGWVDRVIINSFDGTVQTADVPVDAGYDLWVLVYDDLAVDVFYEDIFSDYEGGDEYVGSLEGMEEDPIVQAALAEDFATVAELLPTLQDRSILTDWIFNDFNYWYASEAVRTHDYVTAIEFFDYCAYEDNHDYARLFEHLIVGEVEEGIDVLVSMGFTMLDGDLDMEWAQIIQEAAGLEIAEGSLDDLLWDEYMTRRMWANQPSFKADSLVFGEHSNWQSEGYIGPIKDADYYPAVANLNTLYAQCGKEANGKVLVIRSQKSYPMGSVYYSIDMPTMEFLSYDLYPASLAEVEYIIEVNYDYAIDGNYQQTLSSDYASVTDYFAFLRMKGQVVLKEAASGRVIQQSQWIQGTGDVEAHFSELKYQCSNMPETGADIISAVEKVRQLNAA